MSMRNSLLAGFVVLSSVSGCSGGGGGVGDGDLSGLGDTPTGATGAVPATEADEPVQTFSTTARDGTWSRAARECFAGAADHVALKACYRQLSPEQQQRMAQSAAGATSDDAGAVPR